MFKKIKEFWQDLWWEENHYCCEQHRDGRIGKQHNYCFSRN